MGISRQRIELARTPAGPFRAIFALVDTGSVYTWLPGRILRDLGVSAKDRYQFVMANGEKVTRDRGEVVIKLDGRVFHTICVFGESSDQVLLGAVTLEQFALAVDPVKRKLVPMVDLPAAASADLPQ